MQAAHRYLRDEILSGRLEPGSVLSQVQLAQELGVSRTPLREALRLLETEGLVDTEAQKRVRIGALDLDDLEELYAMRIGLEPPAVKVTVPLLDESDFVFLRESLAACNAAVGEGRYSDAHQPHRAFHGRLFSGAGRRLGESVSGLWDHAERYRRCYQTVATPEDIETSGREHAAILAAAEAGEAGRCAVLVARHLAHTGLSVLAAQDGGHSTALITEALRRIVVGEAAESVR